MTWLKHGLYCIFSNQFHSGICLSWSQPFLHVKSRLQPCRYWLFDQAWESAQLWKDKLAASCWPIATNQSHHRKRLIVSVPALHNRVTKGYEEAKKKRKKKNRGVFNKHRRSGPWDVSFIPTQGPIRSHVFTDGLEWTQSDTGAAGPTSSAVTMTTLDWFRTWESG